MSVGTNSNASQAVLVANATGLRAIFPDLDAVHRVHVLQRAQRRILTEHHIKQREAVSAVQFSVILEVLPIISLDKVSFCCGTQWRMCWGSLLISQCLLSFRWLAACADSGNKSEGAPQGFAQDGTHMESAVLGFPQSCLQHLDQSQLLV